MGGAAKVSDVDTGSASSGAGTSNFVSGKLDCMYMYIWTPVISSYMISRNKDNDSCR